ncbi:MAG: hypothetical protein Q4D52_05010 [Eubacteriales bacterium]|nr:hypothetical protein [Eubacteriales bacterium]
MHKDGVLLHALHHLIADLWKGDPILWFGDECSVPEQSSNRVIQHLYTQSVEYGYPGEVFSMICESYRNVSCFFKEAEKGVLKEIECLLEEYRETGKIYYNEYGIDLDNPYEDLFLMNGRRYQYTINHTKKIYYSLDETEILFQSHKKTSFRIHYSF